MTTHSVGIGQMVFATGTDEMMQMIGLGSCVGVVLTVPGKMIAAVHALLPEPARAEDAAELPGKAVRTAIPVLLTRLEQSGLARARTKTWVVGGAQMFSFAGNRESLDIGTRNVEEATSLLRRAGLRPDVEHTGGTSARSLTVTVAEGVVRVR